MSATIRELDASTFEEAVRKGVTLVDFWAPWCAPCRMQLPILEQIGTELSQQVQVAKVNVDESARTAARFGVRSVPTLILFRDGHPVTQFVGVQSAAVLRAGIEDCVPVAESVPGRN
jgi:thioredoxin 1